MDAGIDAARTERVVCQARRTRQRATLARRGTNGWLAGCEDTGEKRSGRSSPEDSGLSRQFGSYAALIPRDSRSVTTVGAKERQIPAGARSKMRVPSNEAVSARANRS